MPFRSRKLLTLLLSLALAGPGLARPAAPTDDPAGLLDQADPAAAADALAAQVREVAGSRLISKAKKEKRISTAVRIAVVTVTAYQHDPAAVLATAIQLAERAANAAPDFAEVIVNAAAFTPAVARIENSAGRIRTAALAAAKGPRRRPPAPSRAAAVATAPMPDDEGTVAPPARSSRRPAAQPNAAVARRARAAVEPEAEANPPVMVADDDSALEAAAPRLKLGQRTSLAITGELSARHDDNVFLTAQDQVGDTILSVTPGVHFRFGLESLARGSLNFTESFIRYLDKSAPNVSLAAGTADYNYDNGALSLAGTASYQQLNQNSSATASLGAQIFRRDVLDLSLLGETALTPKTRLRTGVSLNRMQYKNAGLIGTSQAEIPLKLYFATTAKTNLSAGVNYRDVRPQGAGPRGHDLYYNVGARGAFTEKLSGELSVGYRSREVGPAPRENLWGFDGTFHYAATLKTNLSLLLSRDFSTGALGESLKTDRYALKLAATPTPQWSFSASASYQDANYGPAVFSLQNTPVTTTRQDGYWEGSLQASYLFTTWMTAGADYTLRNNHSTVPTVGYSNNVLNFTLGFRY